MAHPTQNPKALSMEEMTHFALLHDPFASIPNLQVAFLSAGQRDCFDRLNNEMTSGGGIAVITGAAGIGKTTVQEVVRRAQGDHPRTRMAVIGDPMAVRTDVQFLRAAVSAIGTATNGRTGLELTSEFQAVVRHEEAAGTMVCLLIDDAHLLSSSQLDSVRTLAIQAGAAGSHLLIALFAEPSILERIQRKRQLAHCVTMFYNLNPLSRVDTAALIDNRIARAGYSGQASLFSPGAIDRIHSLSRGTPAGVLALAAASLAHGYATGVTAITESTVDTIALARTNAPLPAQSLLIHTVHSISEW